MADENGAEDRKPPTERVILKLERVLVLERELTAEQEKAIAEVLAIGQKGRRRVVAATEGWVEVARVVAANKIAAIRAHAGETGTPDAKLGTFRAPSVTSWKGALAYEAPPQPLVQTRLID